MSSRSAAPSSRPAATSSSPSAASTGGAVPLEERIADYWDGRSQSFDRHQGVRSRRQLQAWLSFLSRSLGTQPRRILDVGTGTGFLALRAAELGHRVTGVDLSAGMIVQAHRNGRERFAEASGAPPGWLRGDAQGLPFADGAFEVLMSRNLIWTLPDPERAVAEWRRLLAPGGLLLLVDGNWFDDSLLIRARRGLGHTLAALAGRRTLRSHRRLRGAYRQELPSELPMMRAGNETQIPQLIEAGGFEEVRTRRMAAVDRAESGELSLSARLLAVHHRFAVLARAPR